MTCFYVPADERQFRRQPAGDGHVFRFLCGHPGGLAVGRSQVRAGADHRHHARASGGIRRLRVDRKPSGRRPAGGPADRRAGPPSGAAALHRAGRGRLSIDARADSQAAALDRGDAAHASLGTSGAAADAGPAVVAGGDRGPSIDGRGGRLSRHLPGAAMRDDLDDRRVGFEAARALEEDAVDSGVGCAWPFSSGWPASRAAAFAGAAATICCGTGDWFRWPRVLGNSD